MPNDPSKKPSSGAAPGKPGMPPAVEKPKPLNAADTAKKAEELSEAVIRIAQQFMTLDTRMVPDIAIQHAMELIKMSHDAGESQVDREQAHAETGADREQAAAEGEVTREHEITTIKEQAKLKPKPKPPGKK